jgi:exonuclease V gamma subunit
VLTVCRSNRAERLADGLAEPLGDPLGPEQVVVQSQGMARWLSLALAERLGVCANVAFPLPAAFIWEVFRAVLPEVPRHRGGVALRRVARRSGKTWPAHRVPRRPDRRARAGAGATLVTNTLSEFSLVSGLHCENWA